MKLKWKMILVNQKNNKKKVQLKKIGKKLLVSESAVSKWKKNITHPDITLLPTLSKILGVTEHELITASIDKQSRVEKVQAKKWKTLSFSWSLFFYIPYVIALIPCFGLELFGLNFIEIDFLP